MIAFKNGQTSIVLRFKLLDSSSTVGAGLTGLTSASAGLRISTIADNEASATAYTQAGSTIEAVTTLGTYAAPTATKCRFKEVDATNHPGLYEFQFADARFAVSSAKSLIVSVSGATNQAQSDYVIPLVSDDPYVAKPANYASLSIDGSGRVDLGKILGTAVSTPATAGILDVNVKNIDNDAASASGTVTFPNATLASTVNITAAAGIAVSSIGAGVITAASIAADAITDAKVASDVTIASVTGAVGSVASGGISASSFAAGAIDNAAIATDAIGSAEIAASAVSEIQSGLSTLDAAGVRAAVGLASASLDTQLGAIAGYIDTEVGAIKTKTDQLTFTVANQVDVNVIDWKGAVAPAMTGDAFARLGAPTGASVSADVAAIKAVDDAIKSKTDNLPSDPADASDIAGSFSTVNATLAAISGYIDTEVAAIKAKTDNLPASPAAVGSAMTLTAAYDAAKTAATQTSVDDLPTNAELTTALGTADDAVLAAIGALNNLSAAAVNAEVDTALADVGLTTTITGRIDAAITTRLAGASYTAPDNAGITAIGGYVVSIDAKTTNLPSDPADQSLIIAATNSLAAAIAALPTISTIMSADVKKVNGVTVTGVGTSGDPWGP